MSGANTFKFVMLPPQNDVAREWGRKLGDTMPEVRVVIAEDQETAEREIVDAEAAFGWLPKELLAKAARLRWLQAPQAAPHLHQEFRVVRRRVAQIQDNVITRPLALLAHLKSCKPDKWMEP